MNSKPSLFAAEPGRRRAPDHATPGRHDPREALFAGLDAWLEERERRLDAIVRRAEERWAEPVAPERPRRPAAGSASVANVAKVAK